jgi:hypothetical protein
VTTYALDQAVFAAQIKAGVADPALADRIIAAIAERFADSAGAPVLATTGARTLADLPPGAAVAVFDQTPLGPMVLPADVQLAMFRGPERVDVTLENTRPMMLMTGADADRVVAEEAAAAVTAQLGAGDDLFIGATRHENIVAGGAGDDTLIGGEKGDRFDIGEGSDLIDGGAGFDIVRVNARFSEVAVTLDETGVLRLTGPDGAVSVLRDVQYVSFSDGGVILNLQSDDAAMLARSYEAVFGRPPDEAGMAYWAARDHDAQTLLQSVDTMLASPEFMARYGAVDQIDPSAFIRIAYQNAFGREPDEAGLAFWLEELARGVSKAEAMMTIAHASEGVLLSDLTILKTPGG